MDMDFVKAAQFVGKLRGQVKGMLESDEAWGPSSSSDTPDSAPGVGGAVNAGNASLLLDTYLGEVVAELMAQYEVGEEEAWDFMFTVADELFQGGELPEMPADEAGDAECSAWLAQAQTMNFSARVLQAAEETATAE